MATILLFPAMTRKRSTAADLPNRIREWRELRGISQIDLAERSGIEASVLSRWERGLRIPRIEQLRVIARLLDVHVADLLSLDDNPLAAGEAEREVVRAMRDLTPAQKAAVKAVAESLHPEPASVTPIEEGREVRSRVARRRA